MQPSDWTASFTVLLNLLVFAGLLYGLARVGGKELTLSRRILFGLLAGVTFGLTLQVIYGRAGDGAGIIDSTLTWTNVIGSVYVNLLKMIVIPLVLVMMIAVVVRLHELALLGRIGGMIIGVLVSTTVVAAAIGVFVSVSFGLSMDGLTEGARELARVDELRQKQDSLVDLGLADMLVEFVPSNIFLDLTGARPTSIIAVVIFGVLFGIAALLVANEDEEKGQTIRQAVDTLQAVIMKLVRLVLAFSPYGILALMTKVVAGSDAADVLQLLWFIVASYVAIALMFVVHFLLLKLCGRSLREYARDVWPVLTFAFSSRSSAATIPLTVDTQVEKLGVAKEVASLAASFGATIGQNGCAGIYPAMLAAMIAPTLGINPLEPGFFLPLLGIVAISSFGIAGVGGGATFAALVVLPAMGLPIALVALLISIEPLVDMARTSLNVNGSITAGVITDRFAKSTAASDAGG